MPLHLASFPVVLRKKALGTKHPFLSPQGYPRHVRSVSQVGMVTAPESRHSHCVAARLQSLGVFTQHSWYQQAQREQVFASISELDCAHPGIPYSHPFGFLLLLSPGRTCLSETLQGLTLLLEICLLNPGLGGKMRNQTAP